MLLLLPALSDNYALSGHIRHKYPIPIQVFLFLSLKIANLLRLPDFQRQYVKQSDSPLPLLLLHMYRYAV